MLSDDMIVDLAMNNGGWDVEDELLTPECVGGKVGLWLVRQEPTAVEKHFLGDLQELRRLTQDQFIHEVLRIA